MPGTTELLPALLLGLLGAGHCLGMCGGISAALAFALGPDCSSLRRHVLLLCYSVGRIASYALLGAIAGSALQIALPPELQGALRFVAGLLLIATGIAMAGYPRLVAFLERGGYLVWKRIAPWAVRLGTPASIPVALLAGAAWGWLPCGLVYGALAWSATNASGAGSATLMAAFGIGTLPAVLASGVLATRLQSLLRRRGLRVVAALFVCAFGVWTMTAPAGGHGAHAHHQH